MISLNEYIKESLLDDEDMLMRDASDKVIRNEISKYLEENYKKGHYRISRESINDKYVVDCYGNLEVKNKNITSLTNEYFEFGVVNGNFNCSFCDSLTSLKGSPEEVGGYFFCYDCKSLTSLEEAPKEIGQSFDCSGCKSLKSLEGAPEKVGRDFKCYDCKSLTSLKGAPKEVSKNFYCDGCKTKFTTDDVKKVSKVKGKIIC